MYRGQPLTIYFCILCVRVCVCIYVCVYICVCGGTSVFPLFCVRAYLSLCVCVFLVRSSAGGDHGGAGEERRQHSGPHHLRWNRQRWETAGIEPTSWRAGGQVGAMPAKKRKKEFVFMCKERNTFRLDYLK